MSENGAKFYEATYSGEGIQKKEKYKFVIIKKVSHLLRSETIETETMHQAQYNKSDKTNHLITFAVDDACKDKLKKCIDSKLKDIPFDKENPQDFLPSLEEFNFESKDDFFYILGQRFNTLATSESEGGNNQLLQEIGIMEAWLNKWENNDSEFDKDKKMLGELSELKNKITENQGEGSKKEKSILNKCNEIKFQIILQIIDEEIGALKQLQDKFKGAVPEYSNIQSLIKSFSSELEKLRKIKLNHKNAEKNIEKANILSDIVAEQCELYGDKFDESIDWLKAKIDVISNQLSGLASLPIFQRLQGLLVNELDNKISIFFRSLVTESLISLENEAAEIERIFNVDLDLVKDAFVTGSKTTLEAINNQILPYSNEKWAEAIRQETASLDSMLNDLSMKDPKQLSEISDRLNKCDADTKEFCSEIFARESMIKTEFRRKNESRTITRFFTEKMNVLDKIKDYGEKIQNGYWGANEKANILKQISSKADAIKSQYQDLMKKPELDQAAAQQMQTDISAFINFIDTKQDVVLRYRGISALKPLAKLWGGGKVTSEEYIKEIKGPINDCGNSASLWNIAKP